MYADQALPVPEFGPAWRLVGQVVDDIAAGYSGFLLHPGDLGYAEGSGFIWDLWPIVLNIGSSSKAPLVWESENMAQPPMPAGSNPFQQVKRAGCR